MPLVIRRAQFTALQLATDRRWYESQLAELYPTFAQATSSQRREWVDGGIRRAREVGLGRAEILQFLCFEQTFSPDCLSEPSFEWARRLLDDRDKVPAVRMKQLRQETIRRLLDVEARQESEAALAAEVEEAEGEGLAQSS